MLADTADTIIIHAVVLPHRYVVLNSENQIQQILSNTPLDTPPMFTVGAIDGPQKIASPELLKYYYSIADNLDFSKPGIIYKQQQATNISPLDVAMKFVKQFLVKIS